MLINPINIYQVFTRLFRNDTQTNKPFGTIEENGCSKFNHFTPIALKAIKDFGITHIWFTGVLRHATCTNYEKYGIPKNNPLVVKGRAGSPYAISDYYDVDPDLAENPNNRMFEFELLVDRCHNEGLKVIIDFVPNHVAREYKSIKQPNNIKLLGANDNTNFAFLSTNNFYYTPAQPFKIPEGINFPYTNEAAEYIEYPAKVTGNDSFTAQPSINDWYETVKLNYGVDFQNDHKKHFDPIPNTWVQMLHIMAFWAQKRIDGLRCDMAEMVPIEFWSWAIPQLKELSQELIIIAEVYNPNLYASFLAAGFDYLYDKVGLYDISRGLIEGHGSTQAITQLWQGYEGYSHKMLRFLENHDEQRIASKQFANNPMHAIPAMVLSATLNSGPLMIYFGQELGEMASDSEGYSGFDGRTTIFDYWHVTEYQKWVNNGEFTEQLLSNEQRQLRNIYQNINLLRLQNKAISNGGFYDLMWANEDIPNKNKIYAYLRHFENEVLLIVLNFDLRYDYHLRLVIPSDAISKVGLSVTNYWKATELIFKNNTFEVDPHIAINEGVSLHLSANSAHLYSLC